MSVGNPPVTFVYHLGFHCTDDDFLLRSLLRNTDFLEEQQVLVPRPRRYRKAILSKVFAHKGNPMPPEEQKEILDLLHPDLEAKRIILGGNNLLCYTQGVFSHDALYGSAPFRTVCLRYLFPESPSEFFFGIRNFATFLPELVARTGQSLAELSGGIDPLDISWADLITTIKDHNPDSKITVWCNEDTPLIWPSLLREIAGLDEGHELEGGLDLLSTIMKPEGFERMKLYLQLQKDLKESQERRIFAAFLGKFAIEDEIEEDISVEDWTEEYVEQLTANYDRDVQRLEQMTGIKFLGV